MTRQPVLYVLACGSPPTQHLDQLVGLAKAAGWDVCAVVSPDGRKFVDTPALAALTGHPVRSVYKNPGDVDVLPDADAMIVAPATVNTINKWALGIADTLPLGLLIEGLGKGLPIVAVPYTNAAMANHPAFADSIAKLRRWGVRVLYDDGVIKFHPPGDGEAIAHEFPWHAALDALGPPPAV